MQGESQQQAIDYLRNKNSMNQEYDNTKRATLNQGAGAGAAFSSAYGVGVGRNALDFQNNSNMLETENSNFQQNMNLRRQAIQQAFNDMLRTDALTRSQNAAEGAGTLGYGQSSPDRERKRRHRHKGKGKR
jgi:hypothetical protein